MQHDLFGSDNDLDLRSNFQHDLLRSNYILFDASRQKKYDDGKINVVSLPSQTLLQTNVFRKTVIFGVFALFRRNETVDLRLNLRAC